MLDKIDTLQAKYQELEQRLADPDVLGNPTELAQTASAHNALGPIIAKGKEYRAAVQQVEDAKSLLDSESDEEMLELANIELYEGQERITQLEHELKVLLLPKDEYDERNVILEIRAGTGGDEAALFAADLYRMYTRYAETNRWKVEELTRSEIGIGGLKEVSAAITGSNVYRIMKFESGVHRVQRVPATEASGRIHTSAATVAVMPEAEEVDVNIPEKDLRIDVYRSSGHGGQSVNTTDSAVRITHLPTGLVVTCQDEKSQHKNKAKALKVLRARLLQMEQEKRDAERREEKRSMVGSGDRSERIRTYNFPENRLTDHRIKLTLYRLAEVMEGDLAEISEALTLADQEAKMAAL